MNLMCSEKGVCFLCGAHGQTELHHIFGGAYRKKSDKLGLTVYLCHFCHNEPPYGVHHDVNAMRALKAAGQKAAMQQFGWSREDFIREFGKNYLED